MSACCDNMPDQFLCSRKSSAMDASRGRNRTTVIRSNTHRRHRYRRHGRNSSMNCAATATAMPSHDCINARKINFRFHWHYTPNGCSVSPHTDSVREHGSQLFYFNSEDDWDPAWGGIRWYWMTVGDSNSRPPRHSTISPTRSPPNAWETTA